MPEAPITKARVPLFGTFRFTQKPTDSLLAPGWMTRFQSKPGATEITPELPENKPFQLVYVEDWFRFRPTDQVVVGMAVPFVTRMVAQ